MTDIADVLTRAAQRFRPVTISYWEVQRDPATDREIKIKGPSGKKIPLLVTSPALYTLEIFPSQEEETGTLTYVHESADGALFVRAMSRVTRQDGPDAGDPAIRAYRLDRIGNHTPGNYPGSVTVHRSPGYLIMRPALMDAVYTHAIEHPGSVWDAVVQVIPVPKIWQIIRRTNTPQEAITRMAEALDVAMDRRRADTQLWTL